MLVLVGGLAACGGGDDDAAAVPTTAPATTAPATTAAVTATTEPVATTTVAGSAPTGTSPGTTEPTFTGDPDSEFCGVAREMDEVVTDPENPFDATFYEGMITTMRSLYDELLDAAPDEIVADLVVEIDAFEAMGAVFADVDYQFLDVELGLIPDSPEIDGAKARVDAYLDQVCAIARDTDDGDDPPTQGTVRELLVEQFESQGATAEQADCMVTYLASSPEGSDMELGIGVMATCGFTQPLIDAGFTAEEAECAVEYLSTADLGGSEVQMGIALVAACNITQPMIDAGFTEDEAACVVQTLADRPDLDVDDNAAVGMVIIEACQITRFFTDRGFSEDEAACMIAELGDVADLDDEDAVLEQLVEKCVLSDASGATPTTDA